jgi:5-methylcytosine-specific restriction protein A
MPRNPPWSHDELLLALDLYMRRGLPPVDDSEVAKLSVLLNTLRGQEDVADAEHFRNANGVHMKLGNFRAHDRPGGGLTHGNRMEAELWERFKDHRDLLAREAARIKPKSDRGPG